MTEKGDVTEKGDGAIFSILQAASRIPINSLRPLFSFPLRPLFSFLIEQQFPEVQPNGSG